MKISNKVNPYVALAKKAIETYVEKREIIEISYDLPKDSLIRKGGAFVTIMKNGNLRGCIGTYLPTQKNIADEIIQNAVAAATEDYRFGPVQKEELSELSYTVYILSKPELVKDIKELNPKRYGIIVKTSPITHPDSSAGSPRGGTDVVFNGHTVAKSALLLPDLEGIDTAEKQISITCQKGGINPNIEKLVIYKFTAKRFTEENEND